MKKTDLNLAPGPRILQVLTYTAMRPIDALCELVDNALDSFSNRPSGGGIGEIRIEVPTLTALKREGWRIRVSDNGPGMTLEQAKKALTAGATSQNPFDRLGLYGVGLNIASGKFARRTRLITATENADNAVVIDLDLDKLMQQKDFLVEAHEESLKKHFPEGGSGTIIELSGRWPAGNVNRDFPRKLLQYGPGHLRKTLGRRYASLLRKDSRPRFRIVLAGESCKPFQHCVWADHRYVERGGVKIYAKNLFNERLGARDRCMECGAVAENGKCIANDSHTLTGRVEEWVRGWIGVQRFDHNTNFGIDLIRKGRAICTFEQDAFFTFRNDRGELVKDYPVDGVYGRIVGEVHLDHVPVNFTKEDFHRSSLEWQQAMSFLRGDSSLQPRQPGADTNKSPLKRIYDGYRKIRKAGAGELYMAQPKPEKPDETKRIDRSVEEEFYKKFLAEEPGYYDDSKWFERVNVSSSEDDYEACPNCEGKNPPAAEVCATCDYLIKSKGCVSCGVKIPQSAESCQHCGKLQVPEGPWQCGVCKHKNNPPDSHECMACHVSKGAVNPFDEAVLQENSFLDENLSVRDVEVELPGGEMSDKFDLYVRKVSLRKGDSHFPSVVFPNQPKRKVTVYMDEKHPLFLSLQFRPHHAAALAAADFVFVGSTSDALGTHKSEHNHVVLAWRILEKYWDSDLSDDPEQVRGDVRSLLDDIRDRMAESLRDVAEDIFYAMSNKDKTDMVSAMTQNGVNISGMERLRDSGEFMRHIPPSSVVAIFQDYPGQFFGKRVWNDAWDIPGVLEEVASSYQSQLKQSYLNCLEDCASFLRYQQPPLVAVRRAKLSIEFLTREFAQ